MRLLTTGGVLLASFVASSVAFVTPSAQTPSQGDSDSSIYKRAVKGVIADECIGCMLVCINNLLYEHGEMEPSFENGDGEIVTVMGDVLNENGDVELDFGEKSCEWDAPGRLWYFLECAEPCEARGKSAKLYEPPRSTLEGGRQRKETKAPPYCLPTEERYFTQWVLDRDRRAFTPHIVDVR
ncbi:hypothetical protein BDV95DRAFT_599785 [Massariosphaeria phaeospora]|uniref:Uncharacterized protein n=1 Tax=Massariosphaeria phaeospora TaxID=100035 RepID=A0A7C8HYR1_9PLEO|nr:hypothetical protein BDV95DRAFT_599785 [Massariosphaeria phaeospora]